MAISVVNDLLVRRECVYCVGFYVPPLVTKVEEPSIFDLYDCAVRIKSALSEFFNFLKVYFITTQTQ